MRVGRLNILPEEANSLRITGMNMFLDACPAMCALWADVRVMKLLRARVGFWKRMPTFLTEDNAGRSVRAKRTGFITNVCLSDQSLSMPLGLWMQLDLSGPLNDTIKKKWGKEK